MKVRCTINRDNERMTSTATALMDRWKKAKVPVELHVFPDGGHGFGMNKKGKSELLAQWMQRLGLLGKSLRPAECRASEAPTLRQPWMPNSSGRLTGRR